MLRVSASYHWSIRSRVSRQVTGVECSREGRATRSRLSEVGGEVGADDEASQGQRANERRYSKCSCILHLCSDV